MDKINWCKKQDKGIKLVEPNENLAFGYLKMSEDSLGTMNREKDKNLIFSISAGYYSIYYSLYAIMQKIGVKCEIHSCSIEFMKSFLNDFYLNEDFELIETAFSLRNLLQYYVGKNANKNEVSLVWNNAYDFFVKSREIVSKLNELQIKQIRRKLG
jgi:uncharacterized protein (UPF0332 family)